MAKDGKRMVRKIALEEHFLCPGYEEYWRTTTLTFDPSVVGGLLAKLTDFGDGVFMFMRCNPQAGEARAHVLRQPIG